MTVWDIRQRKVSQMYQGTKEVLSCDLGNDDSLIASGQAGSIVLWYNQFQSC